MEKGYILNYLNAQLNVLESLRNSLSTSERELSTVIQAKIDVINDIVELVDKAPIPYEMI